ncbi:MinD/ParA family protein [Candidatus Latescibacterota bacterium]
MEMEKLNNFKSPGAKVYAITSGKGGVGKTSIAVNLSIVMSKAGLKVLLIDADMGLANIDLMTGVSAAHTIEEVIEGKASIFDALADGPEGLTVLSAGSGSGRISDVNGDRVKKFRNELIKLENAFDIIFIDTGAGISANVVDFIFMADEVLVVMTAEPTAFADAYAIVKLISNEKPDLSVGIIINICKNAKEADLLFSRFNEIVKRFLGKDILFHGSVPQDTVVTDAIMRQIPLAVYAGKSAPMQSLRQIARNMLGIEKTKQKTIFNR